MKLKNTFGITSVISTFQEKKMGLNKFGGSSLDRKNKKKEKRETKKNNKEKNEIKINVMSSKTKSKIKNKIIALSQIRENLNFVTLTFANVVEDLTAVKILRKFLDNVKKQNENFDYLWVAERQTKNKEFKDNIHFHLITDIFWDIKKYWEYWLLLQKKNGIIPRDEHYKPSSAFDVKKIKSSNIKVITSYLTKYVTKNKAEFKCQVWNCSKRISRLYTSFYSGYSFLEKIEKETKKPLKYMQSEFYKSYFLPINETTMNHYNCIKEENKKIWSIKIKEKKEC